MCISISAWRNEIGNHVMFGPGVYIHGGNHVYSKIGYYMNENDDKSFGDDGKVIIKDDVWIGSNSIVLANVKIGKDPL